MHPHAPVTRWNFDAATTHCGGPIVASRQHAPLGRVLPYRRAAGQGPADTGAADFLRQRGWSVNLGQGGLGDVLLALGLVQALADGTGGDELRYEGPRPRLMRRCQLEPATAFTDRPHTIRSRAGAGLTFLAVPERPPTWLDVLDDERVEVHAALPMRYYLAAEQTLGLRLPADRAPLPTFTSSEQARPFHVVFVSATSWPSRKDYGAAGFARIGTLLAERFPAKCAFTIITGNDQQSNEAPEFEVLAAPDAVDCLDVFASAEIVIGNDTGLTHLAALTERSDGTGPHVIGIHGRHAHTKWTTGATRHHAVATPFAQMLSFADRCPVRDHLDDAVWSASARLDGIPATTIADFACDLAGW